MATFYCDLVDGNDAWAGTGTTTPKKTINAVTALVSAYTDEIKVRGMDSLFIDIGSWTWTDGGRTVTRSGNYTGSIAANDYICKTIVASGTTVPEIYKVSTVAYAAGTDITTITLLLNATYNYYVGTTETVATSKLVLPTAIAAQTINKNGFVNGTATDVTGRQLTKITGGWNSGFTAQETWTFLYGTANNLFSFNNKTYWELSKFIIITTGAIAIRRHNYNAIVNCFAGWNSGVCMDNTAIYHLCYNLVIIGSNETSINYVDDKDTFNYCKIINQRGQNYNLISSASGSFANRCIINNSTFGLVNRGSVINGNYYTCTNSRFININWSSLINGLFQDYTNCIFEDMGTVALTIGINGSFNNCTFDINRNRITGVVSGNITPFNTTNTFLNNSGATGQFCYLNINGIVYNTTRFKLYSALTTSNLKWYNTNNEDLGVGDFTSSVYQDFTSNNIIYNYTTGTTKNAILSKYGYTTLSDDYYTGKTGTTGATNSVLHVVSTNNAACDFTSVDFVINKSNSYNLSFYAKGSGSYTLHWNILNGGQYLYAWQTQAITSGAWQQITKAISASDWKMSGTATLVIRIPSQAKGTYAIIDYIQLT